MCVSVYECFFLLLLFMCSVLFVHQSKKRKHLWIWSWSSQRKHQTILLFNQIMICSNQVDISHINNDMVWRFVFSLSQHSYREVFILYVCLWWLRNCNKKLAGNLWINCINILVFCCCCLFKMNCHFSDGKIYIFRLYLCLCVCLWFFFCLLFFVHFLFLFWMKETKR